MSQVIQFKENPAAGNLGLEKEGRSKFPGCYDTIQPPTKNGRYLTGLDELAHDIVTMPDSKLREETQKKVKDLRLSLEQITGLKLDALSTYWDGYFVKIDPAKRYDLGNAADAIAYHVILASGAAAPSIRETSDPLYNHAKYYVFRDFEDVSDRIEKKDRLAEAYTELQKLLKKPERAIQLAQFLDLNVSTLTPPENVRDILYTFLENDQKLNSVVRFLDAVSRSAEEINIKLIFAEGLKLGVIRQRDGLYQRGNITLGKASSPADAISFLADPLNSGELLSIQEEIQVKRKFG
ncbi:MAG: hypothetical protein E6R03_17680 [Hyphomicrobiaceae bacterium]|nr:MAG: hypothetical protein E6R03_17680 [Hyphomicrobiaceae bacterium]